MTHVIEIKSEWHLSATFAVGLTISALLSLGTFVASASADEFQTDIHSWDRNDELGNSRWGGLYYVAPHPVAHSAQFTGTASEYPLPVFYGPGIGIGLPGFTIGIQ